MILKKFDTIGKRFSALVALVGGIIGIIIAISTIIENHMQIDISGEWMFSFHTIKSTYNDYIDACTDYKMHIIHKDNSISGNGETWRHKGKLLDYKDHCPLVIQGVSKNDTVICNYILKGKLRETTGSFKAGLSGDTTLNGYFSGTGADVKGEFKAVKIR